MWDAFADINMQFVLAGIFGGVVHAIHVRRIGPWEVVGYIVAGGAVANYFTALVLYLTSAPPGATAPIAFGLGYGAFHLCRAADRYLDKKLQLLDFFERPENE
jgi:hypothetical protein